MKTCYLFFIILIFACAISTATAATLQVPSVAVTASHSQQTSTPTNAHTIVITAKDIKQSGAVNLAEVLKGLAGIQINDLNGDGSDVSVSMRGFGANAAQNSLILINGMPLNNPDISDPNLNLIPVESIKKIEIFNGSEGVLFGDQAVGGVINIITKTPEKDSLYADATAGSYDTSIYQEGFQAVGKHHLYGSVNVKKYYTHNYRQHNKDSNEQVYGSFGQQQTESGWNFYYDLTHQLLNLAGALTASQVAENPRQAQNQINFNNNNYQTYQFQQYHWLNSAWKEKFQYMHRNLKSSGVLFDPYTENQTENWGQVSLSGLIDQALLTSGFSYANASYSLNSSFPALADKEQQIALFSQVNVPLTQRLNFIVGARGAEQQNQLTSTQNNHSNLTAWVSTLGLNYQWNPWLSVFVRRDGNFRFPKADEESFTASANNIGGLKTQKGASYELGVNANKNRWYGTASVFMLNLRNELAFNPTPLPNNPFGVNSNLAPTQRLGGLFNVNYRLTQNWLLGTEYTHVSAKFSQGPFSGNHIPFVATNTSSIYTHYQFFTHWSLFSKLIFIGSRYPDGDDANAFPKMPPVTLVNFALRYQRHYLFAMFRVNNIFNHRYNSFSTVNTVSAIPFQQEQFFYPAPGRNFLVTVGFNLA